MLEIFFDKKTTESGVIASSPVPEDFPSSSIPGIRKCRRDISHTGDDLKQCALSCAILAHQGYTVLLVDLEGNVFE